MAGKRGKRLELTWANKDMRLLAHDDVSYEWADPSDWRVSEVRLLQEVDSFGEDDGSNLLIQGDALHALTALTSWPEISAQYVGKVKLCYIDPPFNTGQTFQHYDDAVEHSVWLTMLRDRLVQIKKLLRPDGSVWVHLDDAEQHRARSVLDEVFGAENFVATVIWEKTDSPRMDAKLFSARHDYMHVYRKTDQFSLNQLPNEKSNATKVDDQGRPYYLNPLRARGGQGSTRAARPNLYYGIEGPDGNLVYPKLPDGTDGAWRWSQEKLALEADRIEWTQTKGRWNPNYRIYETADRTRPPETLWPFTDVGSTRNSANEIKEILGGVAFSTPKPERLLQRIIQVASEPGDIVLDCFAGSGTTAAVAHKMKRRWIAVELSPQTVTTFVKPRLEKVVLGTDRAGVSESASKIFDGDLPPDVDDEVIRKAANYLEKLFEYGTFEGVGALNASTAKAVASAMRKAARQRTETTVHWKGGGGFRQMVVAPSMFEDFDGTIVLADWAVGGELAEAVAAQLGYAFEPDGPYAGRKGRSRLAVLDGMLTRGVADHLLSGLGERETLMVVAQALEPGVEEHVREVRSGSRARKVPRDLAQVGRRPSRLVRLGETQDGEGDD